MARAADAGAVRVLRVLACADAGDKEVAKEELGTVADTHVQAEEKKEPRAKRAAAKALADALAKGMAKEEAARAKARAAAAGRACKAGAVQKLHADKLGTPLSALAGGPGSCGNT
jgi:hypothetical protein